MKTKYFNFMFFLLVTILISVVAITSSKSDAIEESKSKNWIDRIKDHGGEHGGGADWVGSGTWGGWGGPREEGGEGQEERSEGGENEEFGREGYEGKDGDVETGEPNEDP
ncbi:hypothetical protein KIW84_020974 [Lathyrus oleraceus]|uniref:Nodule-specific Glycine Rich Peptide n=1 Tax=Pisum sativum TaxID=3888 RepID=A0A9D5B823_PEA|nr:hypothetical protein KIW84_020974 [Pisum sativum]